MKKFWSVVVALLMVAQLGLALHAAEHKFTGEAAVAGEHCVLCKVASTMAAAPAAPAVAPVEYTIATADAFVVAILRSAAPAAAFRSRAPPTLVSA